MPHLNGGTSFATNQTDRPQKGKQMKNIRIKICGITRPEDARKAAELGVDAIGLVFYAASKRAVMEQNGQLTVIQYGDESLRYPLITDGQIDHDILEIIKRDDEWLKQELDRLHLDASKVYIGEYIDGKLVAHPYPS